jgi:hypothetical protein
MGFPMIEVTFSKGLSPLKEGNRASFQNIVFASFQNTGQ